MSKKYDKTYNSLLDELILIRDPILETLNGNPRINDLRKFRIELNQLEEKIKKTTPADNIDKVNKENYLGEIQLYRDLINQFVSENW